MSSRNTISTRFLIISDTHGTSPFTSDKADPSIPKADVLLHCGDISNFGNASEYEPVLSALKAADAELKIVIAGNHDLTLDKDYIKNKIGWDADDQAMVERAKEMWSGPDARANGLVYLEEDVHKFTLKSGATFTIYASPYTPGLPDWAFPYPRNEDRYNPFIPSRSTTLSKQPAKRNRSQAKNPVPSYPAIDIMLTHGPPEGILDRTYDGTSVGCEHLRRGLQRAKPKLHCFGHIHEGRGAEILDWSKGRKNGKRVDQGDAYVDARKLKPGKETLCVNAAIMDGDHSPTNAPWIVDLELDVDKKNTGRGERESLKRKRAEDREGSGESVDVPKEEATRRKKPKREEVENPEVVPILSYP